MLLSTRLSVKLAVAALVLLATVQPSCGDVLLPTGKKVEKVDFEHHVMGLLGRLGCNGGSCHGSFQGKGGFRLSLFGYEPEKDYFAITRDGMARRASSLEPDSSLILRKATGAVEHEGGVRFGRDSWQYQILREWIKEGMPWTPGSGTVEKVVATPADAVFKKTGESIPVQITAYFSNGQSTDVTLFSDFRTQDEAVADVTNMGVISSVRPGSTTIIVSYRGNVVPVRTMIPMEVAKDFQYPKVPEVNYVDTSVFSRLKKLNMVPSDLTSDGEFLRRVTIDTIGQLPTPNEIRTFLADTDPEKRTKKIDQLLAHPLHAALWATKLCDITGNETQALENPNNLKPKRSQAWHDWFRKRMEQNMPYDQIVKGVLLATSRDGKPVEEWINTVKKIDDQWANGLTSDYADRDSLDLYWRRQAVVPPEQWGERTAAAFMGVRLECAQCHKHPFDRWTQAEYRAYANIFATMGVGISPESKAAIDTVNKERKAAAAKNNQINVVKEVHFGANPKFMTHPDTGAALKPKAPGGPEIAYERGKDMRADLYNWLVQPDNPFFARSFVNRIWGHYYGIGIVHPVDDFSIGNPASNQELLDQLAKEFVESKFNIRAIERRILMSRVYQLSAKPNETNKYDKVNFARSYIRPMMAEAVVDVVNSALGTVEKFGPDIRSNIHAVEVGPSQLQNPSLSYAFRIFGRPNRTSACDCDRTMDPALPQKLFLMTDPTLLAKFGDRSGRVQKLLASKLTDNEILDEMFLGSLSRLPTDLERQRFAEYRKVVTDRTTAFTDTMWALINTREFILNH